jgi:predicted  nucleic acid-binding Zn-ribbon protein
MQNLDEEKDDSINSEDDINFNGFKNDAIVVVSNDGLDLENFEELQDDDDVVMAAVKNNGSALQFASERLRADKEIVIAAVKNDPYVIVFASEELQDDDDVLDACETEED